MVYPNTEYDPRVHSSIVSNYRAQWKTKTDRHLTLSDEDIFNAWRDMAAYEPDEGQTEDDLVIAELSDKLDSSK